MPFNHTIVKYINDSLHAGTLKGKVFQNSRFFGIANSVQFKGEVPERPVIAPGVIDEDGEITDVIPDDTFNFQVYHKSLNNVYQEYKPGSVGNSYDILAVSDMQLFVFGVSDRLNMIAEQLEPLIIFGLPGHVSNDIVLKTKMKFITVHPVSSDMDALRNFRAEFQNTDFFIKPGYIFFSIRYQIKAVFNRECIAACMAECQ